MIKTVVALCLLTFSLSAQADLQSSWKAWQGVYKGPFGKNMLQGTTGRVIVTDGSPSGGTLFQAAFRNDYGKDLATNYDFYTANLFSTNYYELMGEYVYGNPYGSHTLDHEALNRAGSQAINKASSMVRHWVLEKYYVEKFSDTRLAKSFLLRGISDVANEAEYANYFFNFFISNINDDFQFLTAALLIKESPVVMSSDLESARNLVALEYDAIVKAYGAKSNVAQRYYIVRNAIHNQPTPDTIRLIDEFVADFGNTEKLRSVRRKLVSYYSFGASKIVELAEQLGAISIATAAKKLPEESPNAGLLLELSKEAVALRTAITDASVVPYNKKTQALQLLSVVAQYLNREVSAVKRVKTIDILETALNSVYIEGFLIYDNWEYFRDSLVQSSSLSEAGGVMAQVTQVGLFTLQDAFEPALSQWISVKSDMEAFIDGKVKASALGAAGDAIGRIN